MKRIITVIMTALLLAAGLNMSNAQGTGGDSLFYCFAID